MSKLKQKHIKANLPKKMTTMKYKKRATNMIKNINYSNSKNKSSNNNNNKTSDNSQVNKWH